MELSRDGRQLIPAVYSSSLLLYYLLVCHDQVSVWKRLLLSNVLRSSSALVLSIFPSFMNISSRASVTSVGILCEFLNKMKEKEKNGAQKGFLHNLRRKITRHFGSISVSGQLRTYSDLYDEKEGIEINESTCPFVGNHSFIPKLNDEQRDLCEGQLAYAECYKVLSKFENNKTPENDRLTYNKIGTLLVDSLNYAYFYGELSNTQKQAVITLIKKKGKDGIDQNLETNISPKR